MAIYQLLYKDVRRLPLLCRSSAVRPSKSQHRTVSISMSGIGQNHEVV